MSLQRAALLFVLLASGSACDSPGAAPSARNARAADSVAPAGEWVTIMERNMGGRSTRPERFETRSDSLRVITTTGTASSSYIAGLIVTNVLSDATSLPVASIRVEQRRLGETAADTTVVEVPAGPLYLFVARHQGLNDWTVTLQEFRPSSGEDRPSDPPG